VGVRRAGSEKRAVLKIVLIYNEHNSLARKTGNTITFQQAGRPNNACVPLLHQVYKPTVLQVRYQSSGIREVSPTFQNNALAPFFMFAPCINDIQTLLSNCFCVFKK